MLVHIIVGVILFWIGIKIVKGSGKKPSIPDHLDSALAYQQKQALDYAQHLITQLDGMLKQESNKLATLESGLELTNQVAMDALAQYERAKQLLEEQLLSAGFSEQNVQSVLSQLESNQ